MPRKFALLAATIVGVSLALTGLAIAAEGGPLEKQMETVQKKINSIRKATKAAAGWKKDGKNVAVDAAEISKIGKESVRKEKTFSDKAKKPHAEWEKMTDDMIKAADELAVLAAKPATKQPDASAAYLVLNRSCTACHAVFKPEEDK